MRTLTTDYRPAFSSVSWKLTRRGFLAAGIGGLLDAACDFGPPSTATRYDEVRLPQPLDELGEGAAVLLLPFRSQGFLMADGGGANSRGHSVASAYMVRTCGQFSLLASSCSHLGCTVRFNAAAGRFDCPCHGSIYQAACAAKGSRFAVDGRPIQGPARDALGRLAWRPGPNAGTILVEAV
jgi:nitrite reductase/ring-hydroxylating ferredoxin subunit